MFGAEVPAYIDEIYKRGLNLWRWNQEYRDYTQEYKEGYDHKKVVDEMHKELTWLVSQFEPAKELFKKYLDISNKYLVALARLASFFLLFSQKKETKEKATPCRLFPALL